MDETAANGPGPAPEQWRWDDEDDNGPPPPREPGEIFLQLNPESRALLEDEGWFEDENNAGRFDEYKGQYVAIYHKRLYGHGPDPLALRERVVREFDLPAGKIVVEYIHPGFLVTRT